MLKSGIEEISQRYIEELKIDVKNHYTNNGNKLDFKDLDESLDKYFVNCSNTLFDFYQHSQDTKTYEKILKLKKFYEEVCSTELPDDATKKLPLTTVYMIIFEALFDIEPTNYDVKGIEDYLMLTIINALLEIDLAE